MKDNIAQLSEFYKGYQLVVYSIQTGYNLVIWNSSRSIILHKTFEVESSLWIKFSFDGVIEFGKWWIDNLLEGW